MRQTLCAGLVNPLETHFRNLQTYTRKALPKMTIRSSLVTRHSSLVVALALCALAQGARAQSAAAATPYTFLGRVMDARHAGFDGSRICALSVSVADSGDLLAETKTFFREDTRRNYVLKVPVATAPAAGYAVQGSLLAITATDDLGKKWSGIVLDPLCGPSGGVREVDIVLGEDLNDDGIDDSLYNQLREEWEMSDYWRRGETFDPTRDYDGDGASVIAEAYAGTDPFDPEDVLRITAFSVDDAGNSSPVTRHVSLTFPTIPGRAYVVATTTNLTGAAWSATDFYPDAAKAAPVSVLSVPSSAKAATATVYLLPITNTASFFRIHAE